AARGMERGGPRGHVALADGRDREARGDLPGHGGAAGPADRREGARQEEGVGHRRLGQRARGQARQVMRPALLVLLLAASSALGAVGTATVVEGPAFRTPKGGAEQPLAQGAEVELEDTLRTGAGGGVKLTLTDQSVVVLGPDSELAIERAEFAAQERSKISLKLLVGGVWAKVKKLIAGSDSNFEVSAARAVAGVRGTIFRVDATPL